MNHGNREAEYILYALVSGPTALSWGLMRMREAMLVRDIPPSKVRSAAMGLVALSGAAKPSKEMTEPLFQLPCCWWRCVVQELRSSGRNSYWADIKDVSCLEPFYIEDDTGKVLVDPQGAELRVQENTIPLDSGNREKFQPALDSWGIGAGWFGLDSRRMRIKERLILPSQLLYALGELAHRMDLLEDRKQRFLARLEEVKNDPKRMAEADANKDGVVDGQEWDAFRAKLEQEFLREESVREAEVPESDRRVLRKPAEQPFILAAESERQLEGELDHGSLLGVLGGIAISGLGVWLALRHGFSPEIVAALAAGGCLIGFVISKRIKNKEGNLWASLFSWS